MKKLSKKAKIILIVTSIILLILVLITIFLAQNKTFFKNKYIGVETKEIFVPRFSWFDKEENNKVYLNSLKSKKVLVSEVGAYLETLDFYVDTETTAYKKNDLTIYSYRVENKGWYRKIIISYK